MIGRELEGRYRVLDRLGEGAMGEVFLVEHTGLGRREALKILRATFDDSPEIIARFRREARATNRLQHPNIVCVYDFGRLPDGRFYIASEFADGESLDVMLRRAGRFPVPRALHVLAQLADAVDHAHSRGVIHRDLKPANLVLVERRGHADVLKVLDFGIAKIIAPDYTETVAATAQGQVFGTPAYMAPEQVGGQGRDPRIDIYAIGCIAHELVVGNPPFTGKTIEVMNAHLMKPPPRPSERRLEAGIPPALDDVILRCLDKDPDRRFQSGRDLADALKLVPGFPVDRGSSIRMPRYPASGTPAHLLPRPDDYEAEPETGVRAKGPTAVFTAETLMVGDDEADLAAEVPIDPETARQTVEVFLVQLAEALIDHGCRDHRLSMLAVDIASARGAHDAVIARILELERAGDEAEQRGREREARLAFAISELRFDLEQARSQGRADPDIEFQLTQLVQRQADLASEVEREQSAITDRAIEMAAERATREDALTALFSQLAALVDENLPRFSSSPSIADLSRRLTRARAALHIAERAFAG